MTGIDRDLVLRVIALDYPDRQPSDTDIDRLIHLAERAGLDPVSNEIYLIPRWDSKNRRDRWTVQTGIDGFRSAADATGKLAGMDRTEFAGEIDLGQGRTAPKKAIVTIYKMVDGVRCPFPGEVRWDEYYPGDRLGRMWKRMPTVMLGKCAEAVAFRRGFSRQLSGIYTNDEMRQADREQSQATGETVKAKRPNPPARPDPPSDEHVIALGAIRAWARSNGQAWDEALTAVQTAAGKVGGVVPSAPPEIPQASTEALIAALAILETADDDADLVDDVRRWIAGQEDGEAVVLLGMRRLGKQQNVDLNWDDLTADGLLASLPTGLLGRLVEGLHHQPTLESIREELAAINQSSDGEAPEPPEKVEEPDEGSNGALWDGNDPERPF